MCVAPQVGPCRQRFQRRRSLPRGCPGSALGGNDSSAADISAAVRPVQVSPTCTYQEGAVEVGIMGHFISKT